MMSSELISEGSSLMLFGMGFVFLFLSLLVLVTGLMSKIITRFVKESTQGSSSVHFSSPVNMPASASHQDELVAAISAAIQLHRTKKD